jgi:hypothetical protein
MTFVQKKSRVSPFFLISISQNENQLLFLETISSKKRPSTTTINRISLSSISLKRCRISQPMHIDNIVNARNLKDSVQEKFLFKKYFNQYQDDNKRK